MSKQGRHTVRSPFKFLDAYTREDRDLFFGREEEVEELYQFVQKNRIVLVYGPSGAGKTSLVQCGLANRFEATDWVPFYISRGNDLNESLLAEVGSSRALGGAPLGDAGLLDALERISTRYVRPVYLIFDQFEELLILGKEEEIDRFLRLVAAILQSPQTASCVLLFIMREEYFARLDRFERQIPHFAERRLRVEPMRRARLEEVILQSCAHFRITLEEGSANAGQIIDNLKAGVSLPYVQVYLDLLWREDYQRTYPQGWSGDGYPPLEFTTAEIDLLGEIDDVLDRFLTEQEGILQAGLEKRYPGAPPEAVKKVLGAFVSKEGTKRSIGFERQGEVVTLDYWAQPYLPPLPAPEALGWLLAALENSRLLRAQGSHFELAHDSLAHLIDANRSEHERRLNELYNRLHTAQRAFADTGEYYSERQLAIYDEYRPELEPGLPAELSAFVEDSRRKLAQDQQEALRRQQEELAREKALRGEAETARKLAETKARTARRRTRVAALVALLAILLAGAAYWFYQEGQVQKQKAEREALLATISELGAKVSEQKAEVSEQKALLQKNTADMAKNTALAEAENARRANTALAKNSDSLKNVLTIVDQQQKDLQLQNIKLEAAQQSLTEQADRLEQNNQALTLAQASLQSALYARSATARQTVDLLLSNARKEIRALRYDSALVQLQAAVKLGEKEQEVAEALLEVAYFWAEADKLDKALPVLQTAARHVTADFNPPAQPTREWARNWMKNFSANAFDFYEKRYYPDMVLIEGGAFTMGCDPFALRDEFGEEVDCPEDELPQHEVRLSDFRLARTETTVWQFYIYCEVEGIDIREFAPGWGLSGDNPIVMVDWFDAAQYANWLGRRNGWGEAYVFDYGGIIDRIDYLITPAFRLPTEAQWEYAARGGQKDTASIYSGVGMLEDLAWYDYNSEINGVGQTHPVATKRANELGLYDMTGNALEWCQDWYDSEGYHEKRGNNPVGPKSGFSRVLRGGSWINRAAGGGGGCRVSYRSIRILDVRDYFSGFRLSRTP